MIKVGIIGGAGYTGGELIRLLINHPEVEVSFIHSKSNAANRIDKVHADLIGEELFFSDDDVLEKIQIAGEIDALFLCMGHGDSRRFLEANTVDNSIKIIDLANDFRLVKDAEFNGKQFVYGLPELNLEKIKTAQNIANPGCFATTLQLGLLPLAKAGLIQSEVYSTGITGSTGAGQSLSPTSHFSWRANNIQAYKTLTHQDLSVIKVCFNHLNPGIRLLKIKFVPWRGDFTRGIFISSTINCDLSYTEVFQLYKDFYANAVFTQVSDSPIFLKQVVNTNKCVISMEKVGSKLVVHSATDNLLKGASGQAVQNMNILFGLNEKEGLKLKANYF